MEISEVDAAPGPAPVAFLRGHTSSVTALFVCGSLTVSRESDHLLFSKAKSTSLPLNEHALISGDSEGNLFIWDLNLRQIRAYQANAHRGSVLSIEAHEKDWRQFLTYGRDGFINFWNPDSFPSFLSPRKGLTIGGSLCGGSSKMPDRQTLFRTEPNGFCRMGVFEYESLNRIVVVTTGGGNHGNILMWDARVSATKPVRVLRAPLSRVAEQLFNDGSQESSEMCMCLCAIPEKYQILAGYENNLLYAWDCRGSSEQILAQIDVFRRAQPLLSIDCKAMSPQKVSGCVTEIAAGGMDGQVAFLRYNASAGRLERNACITVAHAAITELAYRPCDNRILVAGCADGCLRVLSAKPPYRKLALLKKHRDPIRCLRFANSDALFASGGEDMGIALWNPYPISSVSFVENSTSNENTSMT